MVPVCFLRYSSGMGLRWPLRCPRVLVCPNSVWACSPASNYPARLADLVEDGVREVWKWCGCRKWMLWV